MILTNSVIVAVAAVLAMSMAKINVVIALVSGALLGGVVSGMTLVEALRVFSSGLGGGAEIALNYAILGAFASAVAHSGVPIWLSHKIIELITKKSRDAYHQFLFKVIIVLLLVLISILSKNLIPVHVAFIPILIPPLLGIFSELKMDRRLLSNGMTFGLIITYMVIPYGFGNIFLENIFLKNLLQSGMDIGLKDVLLGMIFPALGMLTGLITSCYAYGKPRIYDLDRTQSIGVREESCSPRDIIISGMAILGALIAQLCWKSTLSSALFGFFIFAIGGVVGWRDSDNVVAQGFKMMSSIAFIMIAAAGFSAVLRASGDIQELVNWLAIGVGSSKFLAALGMVTVGLLITMGIGSSFSTVPIIATIYVPLCMALGFSNLATICITAAATVTGDAGSPVSDTMLACTAGLNADGQHDHIWDTSIPGFIHFNIPLIIFGVLGAMIL
ncbi:MAG: TRAP transporter large permease subunit [Puniceicoccales bacterium]|jgi:predicted histidine transporter YuiF (NhaC family)|nr:TRAP transporter large permease subunit [Puniceicoccales bacterium]